jgi:septum site-determining protein MinC
MSQADLLDQDPVFQLKGSMLAITVLELTHYDLSRLDQQLAAKVAQAPNFFSNTPLVLALDKLKPQEPELSLDLEALMALCRHHGLRTLAVRASLEAHVAAALALDLPVLPPSGARERPIELPAAAPKVEKPAEPEYRPSKLITSPVRGGQQIYAAGGDLIVMATVSAGAELLADGNIHVYGPMRGRALAGVKGNTKARIFCQQMGAEMLSIAGQYKVAEDLRRDPLWGQPVQVALSADVLNITRL